MQNDVEKQISNIPTGLRQHMIWDQKSPILLLITKVLVFSELIWPLLTYINVDFRKRNKKSWQSLDNKSMESGTWDVNKNRKKFSRNNDYEKNHNSLHDIKIYWKAILGTALDSVLGLPGSGPEITAKILTKA